MTSSRASKYVQTLKHTPRRYAGILTSAPRESRSSICVENTATLKALLHAEIGWSIVPEELVETELNDSSLVRVKPHVPWVDRVEYFVISKRDCTKRKILDALAALLFEDLGVLAPTV